MHLKKKFHINLFYFLIIIGLGFFLAKLKGYGNDVDSHSYILVFINLIENNIYNPARFYGHPVAELLLGFLAYNFGAFVSNFLSYLAFIAALVFLYKSFDDSKNNNNLFLFLLLCISNSLLFFDNANPSDFPWALFFFSSGFYCMRKKYYEISAILFGIAIGCRANFAAFVYVAIFSNWIIK